MSSWQFLSPAPDIRLIKSFSSPLRNAVATARTCYSGKGIVEEDQLAPNWKSLAISTYRAGHHTTLQHAHFQFFFSSRRRHTIWSFLHAHPFYNSEQISQRYIAVSRNALTVPPLQGSALEIFRQTTEHQFRSYQQLTEKLLPLVEKAYLERFPQADTIAARTVREVRKRSQEIARYVLPICTQADLYHTISAVTLLRYYRCCLQPDNPTEQSYVAGKMIEALLQTDPDFALILEEPLQEEAFPENRLWENHQATTRDFLQEFDQSLAGYASRLISYGSDNETILADSVREVLGIPARVLSDEEAISLALDPLRQPLLGETLNLTTHSKLSRTLFHPHYTFRRRLSHTADSQDQRHRMTPASRPILAAHQTSEPDYVEPAILPGCREALILFRETMDRTWEAREKLQKMGVPDEYSMYLLPNAAAVRYTESADLLNLRHKFAMRLCYNAQEEIWKISREELLQIRKVHPRIGRYLLPPCSLRDAAGRLPKCPEGERFCGVPVWRLSPEEYRRLI